MQPAKSSVGPLARGLVWMLALAALATVQAQSAGPPQTAALVEALRLAAPAVDKPDLYSDWQVKADNIARWSLRCLGVRFAPADFEANPIVAREILECKMGEVLREQFAASGDGEQAVLRTAAWWMTGDPQAHAGGAADYARRVLEFYRQVLAERGTPGR